MLSKEEKKKRNTEFFQAFREFMSATRSVNGRKMNWLNYPTDVKDIYVRLHADSSYAAVNVDIQSKDEGIRALIYEQFGELQRLMEAEAGTDAIWYEAFSTPHGQVISRIEWRLEGVSLYKPEDHPAIFTFFREKLSGFDRFYQEYKEILILLTR